MIANTHINTPGARENVGRETFGPHRQSTIETTRLSLTALKASDLEALMAVFSDKACARMTHAIPHPLSREAGMRLLATMAATENSYWAIRIEDEQLIGVISLTRATCGTQANLNAFGPNLSVFIAPEHQGEGYAREAIDGLLRWVKKRKLHRVVQAAHFADNLASARVLIETDFLYTGRKTMETSLAREGEHQALHMIRIL